MVLVEDGLAPAGKRQYILDQDMVNHDVEYNSSDEDLAERSSELSGTATDEQKIKTLEP